MKVKGEYIGGRVWQCVIFPDVAINGSPYSVEISFGWLFWVLRFEFSKEK